MGSPMNITPTAVDAYAGSNEKNNNVSGFVFVIVNIAFF